MGYLMGAKPFKDSLTLWVSVVNLTVQLYSTYLMLLFTGFVGSDIEISAANQIIMATMVTAVFNLLVKLAIPLYTKLKRSCLKR